MSTTVKARDFEKAALKKGFTADRGKDHIVFTYVREDGKIERTLRTKISHNAGDISSSNLSKMKRQLGFSTIEEFQAYISCTLNLDEYRHMLKNQGLL
ncbi:MAG TPA: type II toxin-antitoxin system HicA family toxin [Methanocorpusculum sp.]|nr:type II toxin-antitoxin system HicA family toxin [Methanocorpusculum sp.]